jgi:HPt (histidine-containing phosphotransfer) domain-containing protein
VKIDEFAALALLDGNRELLRELAQMYCEDSPHLLIATQVAVEAGDTANARRTTHSLKGLAASFYAQPTVDIANRLELEAAEGRLRFFIDGGAESLSRSIASLITQLKVHGLAN